MIYWTRLLLRSNPTLQAALKILRFACILTIRLLAQSHSNIYEVNVGLAFLAQLDRASGYGPEGRGFESSRTHISKIKGFQTFKGLEILYFLSDF